MAKTMIGQVFDRLTVIADAGRDAGHNRLWRCLCICGAETIAQTKQLRGGHKKSCGCLIRDVAAEMGRAHKTHGEKRTPLYGVRDNFISRCTNPKHPGYRNYGGRGITVCPEWRESFEAFRDWALANGYAKGLTLDRADNNAGYSPDNCRWATPAQQTRNRRCTKLNEIKAAAIRKDDRSTKIIAEEFGVSRMTVRNVKTRRTWV